jgi:hypothetical protein
MSINVSTFELLVKPIAPRALIPANFRGVARRVVQGYFLTITNLFNEDIRFRFQFDASQPIGPVGNRAFRSSSLAGAPVNVDLLYDIAGENFPLERQSTGSVTTSFVRGEFTLPRFQTATVQLLPRLTAAILSNPDSDLEIRGRVRLSIPANSPTFGGGVIIPGAPQAEEPVPVLIQPEIRGTFLPNDLSTDNVDFDQINYSLTTASGRAENEVEPDGFTPFSVSRELLASVMENLRSEDFVLNNLAVNNSATQLSNLVATLSELDPSIDNLAQLSDFLTEMGIPINMKPAAE